MGGRVAALGALVLGGVAGCRATAPITQDVVYAHGAVAADHVIASQAGLEMLERGGNAVDAAVAARFCLSVVRPYSCGLGGGGFMLIHIPAADAAVAARDVALDYRETAPAAVGRDYFVNLDDPLASRYGVHAVAVPGAVAGLLEALERYGTLDRAVVLEPAIRAARDGFVVDVHYLDAVWAVERQLDASPGLREGASYAWEQLCHRGAIRPGDRVTDPQQARALELIARDGADAFYRGPISRAIVDVIQAGGGPMTREDLAGYRPVEMEPLRGRFEGHEVLCMPPPSSGGVAILQILGILESAGFDAEADPHNGVAYVHLLAEAMKHAFADRAEWLADPAFTDVPTERLLDAEYLAGRARTITASGVLDPYEYGSVTPAADDGGTSHLSVVDGRGMAVACTETINLRFGSLVSVPGYGFVLNDEMDDFTTVPGAPNAFGLRQSERNAPEPGKRPLSSMSPTIVLTKGGGLVVAGASGGPRIITGTLECVLDCLVFGMTPAQAVALPRFHHQWMPGWIQFEDAWSDEATIDALRAMGHGTARRASVGEVQVIEVRGDGVRAASDPRKGGRAVGY